MLHSKAFSRKTKRGTIIKTVKEHYLRDDLYCSLPQCKVCPPQTTTISATPRSTTSFTTHYIIPDTNILYHHIDFLEHEAIKNVIILQITLQELRHRSIPVYNRVRLLIEDPKKGFVVFCNENNRETFIKNQPGESGNDRNDRAIRKAVEWYSEHISSQFQVVLITNDKDNRMLAKSQGLLARSISDYVENELVEFPDLIDIVGSNDESQEVEADKFSYSEHLSATQCSAGLKSGAFHQGVVNISMHNYLEATMIFKELDVEKTFHITGRENLNRAVQGDVVAVQVLPRSEWKNIISEIIQDDEDSQKADGKVDVFGCDEILPTVRVVGIIKRNWRPFCGTIDATSVQSTGTMQQSVFFWPMDRRIPKIRIRTRQAKYLLGKRIIIAIDSWSKDSRYPAGHFVRILGDVGDIQTETEVLLLEYDVPFAPFSQLVLSYLPVEGTDWIVEDSHLHGRIDFRNLDVCSIDPPGCTDIDDALHAKLLPNGNYEVGVHIADVSHFVKAGNAMDLEGQRRGTTVYLVDKRIDMLPSLLGTNLCSLKSNVDRLSFSCIWEMTPNAKILNVKYSKSVIRSKASLTYDEAQARLDDPEMLDNVSLGIKSLNMLAKQLRAKRMEAGALTLASPEVRFRMENDSQDPVDVEMKELKDTNALVEEVLKKLIPVHATC